MQCKFVGGRDAWKGREQGIVGVAFWTPVSVSN